MTCGEIRERLLDDDQAYLEPEVRDHLEDCLSCNELFEELMEIEALNRSFGRQERAPMNFTGQVIHRVSVSSRLRLPALGAAVLMTMLLLAVGFVRVTRKTDGDVSVSMGGQAEAALAQNSATVDDLPYPVDFDLQYPRVRIYVIDPPEDLDSQGENSSIEILPGEQTQGNYLHYVSY